MMESIKEKNLLKISVPRFTKNAGFQTDSATSKLMKRIRSSKTKPEIFFRKSLWKAGIRYRINNKHLPGKPDLILTKFKIAVFIDGDFWHGYNWHVKKKKLKSNLDYWIPKIERNIQRDVEVNELLELGGWRVVRFWEHEIKADVNLCISRVVCSINS